MRYRKADTSFNELKPTYVMKVKQHPLLCHCYCMENNWHCAHNTGSDHHSSHYGKYPHCMELQLSLGYTNIVPTEYILIKIILKM